jgi:2-methylisocitrate lyase-like PEP mutase family enzyme
MPALHPNKRRSNLSRKDNDMSLPQRGQQLRDLFARKNNVTSIFGAPSALHARIMEHCGIEALFVGGARTAGNYTGFSNTSMASMTELTQFAGYISRAVTIPVLVDVDTGPGSLTALERTVEDCIRAGMAGIRMEDQPAGRKRQSLGYIEVVPREEAVARFKLCCAVRDRLDPSFVIGAKTYARKANGGGLQEGIDRLNLYHDIGVDTVHFQSAQSMDEIREVRRKVTGTLAFVQAAEQPSLEQHVELGIEIAWFTSDVDEATRVATYELCRAFKKDGVAGMQRIEQEQAGTRAALARLDPLGPAREAELERLYWADTPAK